MKFATLFVCLVAIISFSEARFKTDSEVHDLLVITDVVPGQKLRAYEANWFPLINPRAIQLKGIALEKTGNTTGTIDAVEFDLSTILQTTLAFAYFHAESELSDNGNGTDVSASLFAFATRAFFVFEFDEKNGVPGFQKDADTITGGYDLSKLELQWKPMKINHSMISNENGDKFKVWYITIETTDEVFLLRFIVTGTPVEVSGVKITPDSVKIDFAIRWFENPLHVNTTWTTGPSDPVDFPNAQVGLACAMAALAVGAEATSSGPTNDQPTLQFTTESGGFTGFFSWADQADVIVEGYEASRGVRANIIDTNDPNTHAAFAAGWIIKAMYFSFEGNRPSEVIWDPEVGTHIDYDVVDQVEDSSSEASILSSFSVFVLMMIFAIFA